MPYLIALIILSFGVIHFLEYSSFLSRVSGLLTDSKLTGYAVQQANFVMTRFFFVAMMPLIGLVVDFKIEKNTYLLMVSLALFFASGSYLFVLIVYRKIIRYFCSVIARYKKNGNLLLSFIFPEKNVQKVTVVDLSEVIRYIKNNKEGRILFAASSIVFCCYSIGVFLSFFVALNFYEYRSAIGQLSGVINALATVLLTFYIEPIVSLSIDRNDEFAQEKVITMLLGRLFGVAFISQAIILFIWLAFY